VADDRDRVLHLSLPDGPYRVTLGIPEVRRGRLTLEVYTDEGRALQHHSAAGAGPAEARLAVSARGGLATLVFHAPPIRFLERGRASLWAVSWLRIEPADGGGP